MDREKKTSQEMGGKNLGTNIKQDSIRRRLWDGQITGVKAAHEADIKKVGRERRAYASGAGNETSESEQVNRIAKWTTEETGSK